MFISHKSRPSLALAGMCLLLVAGFANADEVRWTKDLRKAAKQASEQKKPMMVMVSAPWCGYCQQMLNTTFRDEKLVDHLNSCFVPVYLNADENEQWVEQLQVEGLPTTLIISPEMKVVKRLSGYQSAGQLNGQIVKLCDHTKANVSTKPVSLTKQVSVEFDGTCLVSLRDDGKLAKGRAQWTSRYQGHTVYFASANHKKKFDANPAAYWPVADGFCLVSQAKNRQEKPGQPVLAMIYADRVWFFADEAEQAEFTRNPQPYLRYLAEAK